MDRREKAGSGEPSRRTPVKAAGGGVPWTPLAAVAAAVAVVLLIVYLIAQVGADESVRGDVRAEEDDSPSLPGQFFPTQGREHTGAYSEAATPMPFCEGVVHAGADEPANAGDDADDAGDAATPESTPEPSDAGETPDDATSDPAATPTPRKDCYLSNPPSSGPHLGVSRGITVGGYVINIPPDPNVYPHDLKIPRDAIPHILEHAGVYVGWNCADGDDECMAVVEDLEALINNRIDNHDDRVVMAWDSDLLEGEIGMSSWTRVDRFSYEEYERQRVERFVGTHSCRFNPESFAC